jgi:hypothetical protein
MPVSCSATCFLMDRGITRGMPRIAVWVLNEAIALGARHFLHPCPAPLRSQGEAYWQDPRVAAVGRRRGLA